MKKRGDILSSRRLLCGERKCEIVTREIEAKQIWLMENNFKIKSCLRDQMVLSK
jgi:hypothetical protein|tara:strand:- start:61 stop:222 length:162 start_codon:yes stop_codon:yes gene_type:complete